MAAGVRRIEAVTGREAVKYVKREEEELRKAAALLGQHPEVADRIDRLLKHQRELEKEIETLKGKLAAKDSADLLGKAREVNGVKVLSTVVDAPDVKTLRDFGDKLRDRNAIGDNSPGKQGRRQSNASVPCYERPHRQIRCGQDSETDRSRLWEAAAGAARIWPRRGDQSRKTSSRR